MLWKFLKTIFKVVLRFTVAFLIVKIALPDYLEALVFAFYCFYSLGKFICGGYRKKPSQTEKQ